MTKAFNAQEEIADLKKRIAKLEGKQELPWGFIPWSGGECPVNDDVRVDVVFGDGAVATNKPAGYWSWHEKVKWKISDEGAIQAYRATPERAQCKPAEGAHLTAAAPHMYEALNECEKALIKAELALAKARGE